MELDKYSAQAVAQSCSTKKVFRKISQIHRKKQFLFIKKETLAYVFS